MSLNILHPIRSEADYQAALRRVKVIFRAQPGEPEFDELDGLATLLEVYEEQHYPLI